MKVQRQDSSTTRTTPWKEHGSDLELCRAKWWCPEQCTANAWPLTGHWKRDRALQKLEGSHHGAPQKWGPRRSTGTRSGPWNKRRALEKRAGPHCGASSEAWQVVPRPVPRSGPRMFRGGAGPKFHAPAPHAVRFGAGNLCPTPPRSQHY